MGSPWDTRSRAVSRVLPLDGSGIGLGENAGTRQLENYRDHVVTGPRDVPGGQMTVFRVSDKLRAKVEMLGHSIELRGGGELG